MIDSLKTWTMKLIQLIAIEIDGSNATTEFVKTELAKQAAEKIFGRYALPACFANASANTNTNTNLTPRIVHDACLYNLYRGKLGGQYNSAVLRYLLSIFSEISKKYGILMENEPVWFIQPSL